MYDQQRHDLAAHTFQGYWTFVVAPGLIKIITYVTSNTNKAMVRT